MDESYITIAEIAKRLDMPESTVRYYRDRFPAFIVTSGDGRSRRYHPMTAEVMRMIADGYGKGLNPQQIENILSREFPRVVEHDSQSQLPQAAPQQQYEYMQNHAAIMRSILAQLSSITDRLDRQEKIIIDQAVAMNTQAQEIDRLTQELADARKDREMTESRIEEMSKLVTAADDRARITDDRLTAWRAELEKRERSRSSLPWWKKILT